MNDLDLLGSLLGGAGGQQGDEQGSEAMGDLLGSLMGGAAGGAGAGGAGGMGDLLGSLLGGSGAQGASGAQAGLGGLLGGLLGGGTSGSSPLDPIVGDLARKLGLPPEIAQQVVAFVLSKLLSGQGGGAGGRGPAGALDVDDLLVQMGSRGGVDAEYVASTGLADELAEQTGLDQATAQASLQETLNLLGSQMGGAPGSSAPPTSDADLLQGLLGNQ